MNYLELSIENVEEESKKLYHIVKDYDYDIVVFIAKGSFTIGSTLAILKNVPLIEISAKRPVRYIKKILISFIKFIPKSILIKLRTREMKSSIYEKDKNRNITFNKHIYNLHEKKKKILLVDDSIDSGYTIIEAKQALENIFKNAEIKIAVLNCMDKSIIKPDFILHHNTLLCGPWSNDSKYYKQFVKTYEEWKKVYDRQG